jgi:hypothetical protein
MTCALSLACGGDDDDAADPDGSAGDGSTGGSSGGGTTGGSSGTGASSGEGGAGSEPIEIEGTWTSNFGGTEVIDSDSWSADFGSGATVSEIVEFSNDDNAAVLQGPDDLYSRYVWTEVSGGVFHYCTVSYGKASAELAVSESESADDSDPDTTGCAAFPWTKLTRE